MRWNGFLGSVLYAAAAAVLYLPCLVLTAPFLGLGPARGLYLAATVAVYVGGLVPRPGRALGAGLLAGALGLGVLAVAGALPQVAVGLAIVLAFTRSGVLYGSRPARAWLLEASLVAGGLGVASLLVGPSEASVAFALWGFYLVQASFFLVGGVREREAEPPAARDPFERAYASALALLEDDPGRG